MKKTDTKNKDTIDIETLDLKYSNIHDWNEKEYLRIGVVPEEAKLKDGTISLVITHFGKQGYCMSLQACLKQDEIDMIIDGLQKAKKRLIKYKSFE